MFKKTALFLKDGFPKTRPWPNFVPFAFMQYMFNLSCLSCDESRLVICLMAHTAAERLLGSVGLLF